MLRPDGKIMHAELKIGDSVVMISDASEHAKATSAMLYVYVPNVDAVYQQALKAGATSIMEPADQFYGDRSGGVKDPAGNQLVLRHPRRGRRARGNQEARGGIHASSKQGGLARRVCGRSEAQLRRVG